MTKERDLSDLIVVIVKWKKTLLTLGLLVGIISYLSIYFFVEEQFDSTALIIPSEDNSLSGLAGMFGDLQGLPLGLGSTNPDINLFTNIIYSRTMLEEVIKKYDLISVYDIDSSDEEYMEMALETLFGNIEADENDYEGYVITVRSPGRQLSADITNFIINRLNEKLIELNVRKSRENREFLGRRLNQVKMDLKNSEDSLRHFQEATGVFNAEEQVKGTLTLLTELETNLMLQEAQLSIYEKILSPNSPEINNTKLKVEEYSTRLNSIKYNKNDKSFAAVMPIEKVPEYGIEYFRLVREVEINTKMLQFILPLFEQAALEEQKEIPVLRIIDYAVPAVKKTYPPRAVFTVLITLGVMLFVLGYIIVLKENEELQKSEKFRFIRTNLFKW